MLIRFVGVNENRSRSVRAYLNLLFQLGSTVFIRNDRANQDWLLQWDLVCRSGLSQTSSSSAFVMHLWLQFARDSAALYHVWRKFVQPCSSTAAAALQQICDSFESCVSACAVAVLLLLLCTRHCERDWHFTGILLLSEMCSDAFSLFFSDVFSIVFSDMFSMFFSYVLSLLSVMCSACFFSDVFSLFFSDIFSLFFGDVFSCCFSFSVMCSARFFRDVFSSLSVMYSAGFSMMCSVCLSGMFSACF